MQPLIGLKRLFYLDPLTAAITATNAATEVPKLIKASHEVKNVHGDTFGYTQDDASITDYINALTGQPYFRDATSAGKKTIAFTLGEWALKEKQALQGGTVDAGVWAAPKKPAVINKAIIGITKTDNIIIFTNASIAGKVDTQEKNLGLGVAAVAMDGKNGLPDEYIIDTELTKITIPEKTTEDGGN